MSEDGNPIRLAARLLPGRWYQGEVVAPEGGRRCGVGWLIVAVHEVHAARPGRRIPILTDARELMNQAAIDKFPERSSDDGTPEELKKQAFPAFNDHLFTTESEVVSVMELAADRWDVEFG